MEPHIYLENLIISCPITVDMVDDFNLMTTKPYTYISDMSFDLYFTQVIWEEEHGQYMLKGEI